MLAIELFGRQTVQDSVSVGLCQIHVRPCDAVPDADGAEEQVGCESQSLQAFLVFGIEQEGVQLLLVPFVGFAEIIAYQRHVEQQLYIVLFAVTGPHEVVEGKLPLA